MGVCVNLEQGKLSLGEELARRAEKLLEQSIPAQLKDFEQRLVNVKEKHEGIKARYAEQVKVLNEDVAAKNGVGALCVLCVFALVETAPLGDVEDQCLPLNPYDAMAFPGAHQSRRNPPQGA